MARGTCKWEIKGEETSSPFFSCEQSCPQNISPIALILLGRWEAVQVKFFRNPGYMATDLYTGNTEHWLSQAYITCTPYKVYSIIIIWKWGVGRNLFCKYTVHVAVHVCAINILCDQGTEIVCGLCVSSFKCCSFVFVGFHHNSFPSLTMA